nr:unnamed protein product [Digitaria exilis]
MLPPLCCLLRLPVCCLLSLPLCCRLRLRALYSLASPPTSFYPTSPRGRVLEGGAALVPPTPLGEAVPCRLAHKRD